jgi:DNA invertase Pin-like site-specific DNA recombinase
MSTTAYYSRVSTSRQDTESQKADMNAHAAHEREKAQVELFEDTFTGKSMDRPDWNRLWAKVLAGKVQRIVVWRLDRLGRTVSGLSKLFEELQERKVSLVSLRDGLDLATPAGRLMAHVLASVAAYELEVRADRQRAGISAVRAANGGRCTWGGRKVGQRITLTEEKERAVQEMLSSGKTVTEIARLLGIARKSVYVILKRQPQQEGAA